ncbi:MAG: phosphatidate cytidylyltransferase [Oscillospiraceae bacterium]|jgi:phosphatidate cytidylyltransferase|nr:phosphatidate cytidylyltransferase [Oscillospiraceae bacterium]
MKVKVIAGLIAASLGVACILFMYSPLPIIVLSGFSLLGAIEICRAMKTTNKLLIALSAVFAAIMPFGLSYARDLANAAYLRVLPLAAVAVVLLFPLIMLSDFKRTSFQQMLAAGIGAFIIPVGFTGLSFIRALVPVAPLWTPEVGTVGEGQTAWNIYWILMALFCCWVTDAFAYFVGKATGGKHKLAPSVSPNKSWEGAVGGVIGAALVNVLLWVIFYKGGFFGVAAFVPPLWLIIPLSVVMSVVGTLGDLTFSAIKRQAGIKDFGNVIPEHGGSLDRFDSYLFVVPALWAILELLY